MLHRAAADRPLPTRASRAPRRSGRFAVAAAIFVGCATVAARADVVILKDGFVLQGDVKKEKAEIRDPATNRTFIIAKAGGFDLVDEGPKIVFFSSHFKQLGEINKDVKLRPDYRVFRNVIAAFKSQDTIPVGGTYVRTTDYNAQWRRTIEMQMNPGICRIEHQITYLDPYTCYLVSPTHVWRMAYRTSELGPALVRKLLSTHPDLIEKDGKVDPMKRIAVARFLLDAGWPAEARVDLDKLRGDIAGEMPKDAREELDKFNKELDRVTAEAAVEEAEKAVAAGRYRAAEELLALFTDRGADPKTTDRATKLMATVRTTQERYASGRRLLSDLIEVAAGRGGLAPAVAAAGGPVAAAWPRSVLDTQASGLVAAAEVVLGELHPDTVGRVEFFVNMAAQAERDRRQGREPGKRAGELLAAAVSGWVKGKTGTTTRPDVALRAWEAREMVLAYQRTADRNARRNLLAESRKLSNALPVDELVQVIGLLPPPEPENLAARTGQLLPAAGAVPSGVFKRRAAPYENQRNGVEYFVRLPAEYRHGRSYPIVLVLSMAGVDPETLFGGLSVEADRNGYVLVAPTGVAPLNGGAYDYDGEGHTFVTAVLRDAARHFSIDDDRVFLFGLGEGANMAMDVGASHPDLFAGIIPWGGTPRWANMFAHYWKNLQRLPLYAVTGELAGRSVELNRAVFKQWMLKGFPTLLTVYKGRQLEWFPAEVPPMFDWMNRKRRISGTAALNLGAGGPQEQWQSMRTTDNRFYWLGTDQLGDRHRIDLAPEGKGVTPGWVSGDIRPGNSIVVKSGGIKLVTVWLTRDMVDWTKPVRIEINGDVPFYFKPRVLEPNVEVLMEDLYRRGDRRMLFLYKVELKGL